MPYRYFALLVVLFFGISPLSGQTDRKWYENYLRGKELIGQGNYEEAIKYLNWAIMQEGKPEKSKKFYGMIRDAYLPQYYLGIAYFMTGKHEAAREHFQFIQGFKFMNELEEGKELQNYLARIEAARVKPPPPPAGETAPADDSAEFNNGLAAFNENRFEEAENILQPVRSKQGRFASRADEYLKTIIRLRRWKSEAETAFRQGEWKKARERYQSILTEKPNFPELAAGLQKCDRALRLAENLDEARRLTEKEPERALVLLREIGQADPAFPGLAEALQKADGALIQQEVRRKSASLEEAIENGEKALGRNEFDQAQQYGRQAQNMAAGTGAVERVNKLLAKITERRQQALDRTLGLGRKAMAEKKPAEARRHFSAALQLDPRNREAQIFVKSLSTDETASPAEDMYNGLLREGLRQYFTGDYSDAATTLKNYLSFNGRKQSLARFFLGAALISRHFLERGASPGLLEEGKMQFSRVRRAGDFTPGKELQQMISPRITALFQSIQ